jgi:hypothetical protein
MIPVRQYAERTYARGAPVRPESIDLIPHLGGQAAIDFVQFSVQERLSPFIAKLDERLSCLEEPDDVDHR